ncbi:MAG: (deoxy)nucleoside triphosphate pyrophosphohydrolase [Clostridium argentinense]|uniref:8-oxo-dGTP diphosphatase n=1 Tax=Clostridium faecium TaxID=2762223 RepID=A0ABR8YSA3_9CLOT|nr:(deoxy)nucleoside triphosphate pyrophosphohydrolase [Clostridium faecium]MBD8046856.1 (deoxy)nucleoside triphosphate pyrophosphohydrolase [Clostridium faecium]MBS5822949.1 (deoxy)nucleoside triphosphate pyrophosphohydrolase [Clostridium argentinense]MDU1349819.1 (deoxy)nucleoside triphosphate pyrophosphohydrolase [Clostridium argentinense]
MKKTVKVVGAVIENDKSEILCALRSKDMPIGKFWEFPGGKIEIGESISNAIIREIKEELNCDIEFVSLFNENTHEYENIIVNLITARCKLVKGTPTANEHAKLLWMPIEYLESLTWAPADIPAVKQLVESI